MRAQDLTLRALPLYSLLMSYLMHRLDWFAPQLLLANTILYLFLVEFLVFVDHYYLLHKWKHMKHGVHHEFRTEREVTMWVAYAFYPLDGLSQGMPIIYAALIVPGPVPFSMA